MISKSATILGKKYNILLILLYDYIQTPTFIFILKTNRQTELQTYRHTHRQTYTFHSPCSHVLDPIVFDIQDGSVASSNAIPMLPTTSSPGDGELFCHDLYRSYFSSLAFHYIINYQVRTRFANGIEAHQISIVVGDFTQLYTIYKMFW